MPASRLPSSLQEYSSTQQYKWLSFQYSRATLHSCCWSRPAAMLLPSEKLGQRAPGALQTADCSLQGILQVVHCTTYVCPGCFLAKPAASLRLSQAVDASVQAACSSRMHGWRSCSSSLDTAAKLYSTVSSLQALMEGQHQKCPAAARHCHPTHDAGAPAAVVA